MLVVLYDEEDAVELREGPHRLMTAAYGFNKFETHRANFQQYLEAPSLFSDGDAMTSNGKEAVDEGRLRGQVRSGEHTCR